MFFFLLSSVFVWQFDSSSRWAPCSVSSPRRYPFCIFLSSFPRAATQFPIRVELPYINVIRLSLQRPSQGYLIFYVPPPLLSFSGDRQVLAIHLIFFSQSIGSFVASPVLTRNLSVNSSFSAVCPRSSACATKQRLPLRMSNKFQVHVCLASWVFGFCSVDYTVKAIFLFGFVKLIIGEFREYVEWVSRSIYFIEWSEELVRFWIVYSE